MDIQADKAKEGLKTVVNELHDPNSLPPGTEIAEQISFLPELPLDSGLDAQGVKRGRGRPPGAKNKNSEAWRDFILSQHQSPLSALAQTYSCTVEQLGRALGLVNKPTFAQALELYKLQIQAAKELAPYIHSKQPIAVDTGEGGLFQLVINNTAAQAAGIENAGNVAFQVLNEQVEENQLVSDADFSEMSQSRHSEELSND